MLAIVGILVVVIIIIAIDIPPLLRRKLKKEIWVFSLLLLFGTVLGITQALNIQIPNPMDLLITVYKPVSNMMEAWLK